MNENKKLFDLFNKIKPEYEIQWIKKDDNSKKISYMDESTMKQFLNNNEYSSIYLIRKFNKKTNKHDIVVTL